MGIVNTARDGDTLDELDTIFNLTTFTPANVLASKLQIRTSMKENQVKHGQVESALVYALGE